MRPRLWRCGRFDFAPGRPLIMGVLNLTPDSFSDGGRFTDSRSAIAAANAMIRDGADIVDIGAESTRPGAKPVPEALELARLLPVVGALAGAPAAISVDTRRAGVMRAVLAAGADMINDVQALAGAGAVDAVRESRCGVCLMHMRGEPSTMQRAPDYRDVVAEVAEFLEDRVDAVTSAGIDASRVVIDPGIGFGKTVAHNLALLHGVGRLARAGLPVLIGVSRKSLIGELTGRGVDGRLAGSLGAAFAAIARGATIVRVHDVRETRDALAVWQSVVRAGDSMGLREQRNDG